MLTRLQNDSFQLEAELASWVGESIPVEKIELVSTRPWARTYQIRSGDDCYFLKELPPQQAPVLPAIRLLAKSFPETVPKVIACSSSQGLLLLAHHGGKDVGRHPSRSQRRNILKTYAALQAKSASNRELLDSLENFDLSTVVSSFLEYLAEEAGSTRESTKGEVQLVGARDVLGDSQASRYHELFTARRTLLEKSIRRAGVLPLTVNHCDLRPQNTAFSKDGTCLIFDWDEVVAGPAGLSLHNSFGGCCVPTRLLMEKPSAAEDRDQRRARRLLEKYISTLVDHRYCEEADLIKSLPGSICAGVMNYLMSFAKFPTGSQKSRERLAKTFHRRLDDLLGFCDKLASQSAEDTLHFVSQYELSDSVERVETLLKWGLDENPDDLQMQSRLAAVLVKTGDVEQAGSMLRDILKRDSTRSDAHQQLGCLLLDEMEFESSIEHLQQVLRLHPSNELVREKMAEATELRELEQRADRPDCVPTVRFSSSEIAALSMSRIKRRLAARFIRQHGCVLIENAFSPELIDKMAAEFLASYQSYFEDRHHEGVLRVGDKRFMITVDIKGSLNSPQVFSPPMVMPIIRRVLGNDCILGSFTSVTSLPHSDDMKMHKDHPPLFGSQEVSRPLPSFGITALVPLIGISEEIGTTRVVKGSHRQSSKEAAASEFQDPYGPKGSCLLMDYRLSHQGLANRSNSVRPVLSLVYSRPWFRDCVNYRKQEPIQLSAKEYQSIGSEHQALLAWSQLNGGS